jgi:hypothetical protein
MYITRKCNEYKIKIKNMETNEIQMYNSKLEGYNYPLPYKYSKYLVYSSCTMSITALVSLYFDETITSIYFFVLFLTSINFWRKPEYGIRHKIDKILVYIGVIYVLFYEFLLLNKEFYRTIFIYLFICIILFFIIEHILCYFYSTKWIIFHMAIHIYVSMMGIFVLFI